MNRNDSSNLALFCDFENIAIGVREANLDRFDIRKVLEKLLLKGTIVVKKAYCDWSRYAEYKAGMHESAFELIDIPHVRQSGKNSADIRMVVDALDLCYTKEHVDTFVIISGDSDFSPLVSKLRENNKMVIGVGVKQSTSDLLISNCDEFIYYDDLARRRPAARPRPVPPKDREGAAAKAPAAKTKAVAGKSAEAYELVQRTLEELLEERGGEGTVWGSMIKQALKRRNPGFAESYYGYRAFSDLLEEMAEQGLIRIAADEKSGGYTVRPA